MSGKDPQFSTLKLRSLMLKLPSHAEPETSYDEDYSTKMMKGKDSFLFPFGANGAMMG